MALKQRLITFLKKIKYMKKAKIRRGAAVSIASSFEGANSVGFNSFFSGHLGFCSYIGNNSYIEANVGKFCSIGSFVRTISYKHDISMVTTSPVFFNTGFNTNNGFYMPCKLKDTGISLLNNPIVIEHDVYIGENVIIMPGVRIASGTVIGTGAVVTKNTEPYGVYVGVPARLIKKRFDDISIDKLLKKEWWNMPINKLKTISKKFDDIEKFLKDEDS